eukprot:gnl/MRDRNA2_/MRDRNA2_60412_c0_seq1.p1 gnl/MRDRNA2_/MRDRNA2_60412_c0~~gnl/MRDRNA2_/MRDRNA2_60412_c0_seq1.p1  ORF type:complete len:551 (-),score=112.49 gnl/MRDRNA2_/MRDRNA2_60412_c0_seq1:229-1881(-)
MQNALNEDVYHVLGVHPGADLAAIRLAYRRLALFAHPDKGGSVKAFQTVAAAFETLSATVSATAMGKVTEKVSCKSKQCTGDRNISNAGGRRRCKRAPAGNLNLRSLRPAVPCPAIARSSVLSSRQALDYLRAVLQSMTTERRRKSIESLVPRVRTALLEFMMKVQEAKPGATLSTFALEKQQCSSAGQTLASNRSNNNRSLISRQADPSESPSRRAKSSRKIASSLIKTKYGLSPGLSTQYKSTKTRLCKSDDMQPVASLSGVGGVNKIGSSYRATVHVASLELYTQLQPKLEVAIEHHSILLEIRQAIAAVVAFPDQDIANSVQTALANAAVPEEELNLRVIVRLRAREWLGSTWVNSPVLSLQKAVKWRSRLLDARRNSWSEFRAAWIELMLERGVLGPCNRRPHRSLEEAETAVDKAWQQAAAYRSRIQARQETLRAKRFAEQARRGELQCKRQAMLRQQEQLRLKRQAAYQERLKSKAARQRLRERLEELRQERKLASATTKVLDALEREDRTKKREQQAVLRAAANKKRQQGIAIRRAVRQKRS